MKMDYKLVVIAIAFLCGLYYCLNYKSGDLIENFAGIGNCPNLLIKKGKELHLLNTQKS